MSRTQQKLEAMSAQERMIQEKKRQIEERMRAENTMKQVNDSMLSMNNLLGIFHFL